MSKNKLKRESTDLEKEVFPFLNELREKGEVNMFGAAPYVQERFGLKKLPARKLVMLWSDNFNNEGNYDEILYPEGEEAITWENVEVLE